MRLLLTGVTGQVGGALSRALSSRDGVVGDIIRADRGMLDLADPRSIEGTLDRLHPDLIINPAAYTQVDRAEDERALAFLVNAQAPAEIARWAAAHDVPLIHFSTDYVFSGEGTQAWREEDAPAPLSVYGASKLAGESAIRSAGGPHLIVRTSWVYAASGRNFLRSIAQQARERSELRVVADQAGAPTSAAVLAQSMLDMLRFDPEVLRSKLLAAGGVVHVAARGETTWHGFATAIVEGLRARNVRVAAERILALGSDQFPTKAQRPHNSRLALQRLQDVFGIVTPEWHSALAPELDLLAKE